MEISERGPTVAEHPQGQWPMATADMRAVLNAARRCRAEWLVGVAQGLIDPTQLVQHAAADDGAPLLKVRLRKLLLARPGRNPRDADTVIEALLREHPSRVPTAELTVAWLLDNRTQGRRFTTWLAVLHATRNEPPWPGFPFTPAPGTPADRA